MERIVIIKSIFDNKFEIKNESDLKAFLIEVLLDDTINQHNDLITVDYNVSTLRKLIKNDYTFKSIIKELESRSYRIYEIKTKECDYECI